MHGMILERVGGNPPAASQSIAEIFDDYAEHITFRARIALGARRLYPDEEEGPQMALHMAYTDGLIFAQSHQLRALVPHALDVGAAIFHELELQPEILHEAGIVFPYDFVEGLYRDERTLPDLWTRDRVLAEGISYWERLNDVCQSVTAFCHFRPHRWDYRFIHKAVTHSLSHYGLLDERKARGPLAFEGYAPQPAPRLPICLPRLMLVHP